MRQIHNGAVICPFAEGSQPVMEKVSADKEETDRALADDDRNSRIPKMCQYNKQFMRVTYNCSKVSWCILKTLHGSIQTLDDGATNSLRAVSFAHKMFM